jgi:DNA-binding transcriptional ArsR family regulator
MRQVAPPGVTVADVLKALSDPIRWDIVQQIGAVEELPCATLETTLPISKPTISYHTKILVQARLIQVRKRGRNSFYTLNKDVVRRLVEEFWSLAPEPRPVRDGRVDHHAPAHKRPRRPVESLHESEQAELALVTW